LRRTFSDVQEAEAFVCHRLPRPAAADLRLESIEAYRSHSLRDVVEGRGYTEAVLSFRHDSTGQVVLLGVSKAGSVPPGAARDGLLPAVSGSVWRQGDLELSLWSAGGAGFSQQELLRIKESIK
jgi:hypothetical protein